MLLWAAITMTPFSPSGPNLLGLSPQAGSLVRVEIANRGTMEIRLDLAKAPRTSGHFRSLVQRGFYNGHTVFDVNRTPRPYVLRAGDPFAKNGALSDSRIGTGGSGTTVPFEENDLVHEEGSVGLSHPPGNRNGGDSQFYIALGRIKLLDGKYTLFGRITSGLEVLRTLEKGDVITRMSVVN